MPGDRVIGSYAFEITKQPIAVHLRSTSEVYITNNFVMYIFVVIIAFAEWFVHSRRIYILEYLTSILSLCIGYEQKNTSQSLVSLI